MSSGYSGTPLARKLTLKDGMKTRFLGMPDSVAEVIREAGLDLLQAGDGERPDAVHIFTTSRDEMMREIAAARADITQDGFIWASWPKKASRVATDITEDVIREIALPIGLVDIKVCAVDEVWSGLKLVIRKELRR